MKHVNFESIEIQNFLSIGEEKINLSFNKGITLITGNNRDKGGKNGVGKSSIIEALYWGLFGQTIREIKKASQIIHNQTYSTCRVEINFSVIKNSSIKKYKIIRTLEPNKVFLFENEENITRSSMPKTDDYIIEIIGANTEVFQNAVIMTINNTTPFMAQKKVDKRKFVEGVLNLGIFGEMLLEIRQEFNDAKKEMDLKGTNFNSLLKRQASYQENAKEADLLKIEKISKLKLKIDCNLEKIKEISSVKDIENKIKKVQEKNSLFEEKEKELNVKLLKCNDITNDLNNKLQQLNFELKNINKQQNEDISSKDTCPMCKRDFSLEEKNHLKVCIQNIEERKKTILEQISIAEKELKDQKSICNKISEAILLIQKESKKNNTLISEYTLSSNNIQNLLNRNLELESEINDIKNEKNNFESFIQKIEEEIKSETNSITELRKKISILETSKFVVSEEGVKTLIVKQMLDLLNNRLNFYLRALEAPCKCLFNESFEEVLHNDKGVECSYFNFSNGERRRIDLAILFMFQDVLRIQTGTTFSLSIYDELLDSAIDDKGITKITGILKDRVEKYNESIYIVSHSKLASQFGIDQTIELEKINGCTKIVI